MSKLTVLEINGITGEQITREMNDAELGFHNEQLIYAENKLAEAQAVAAAKAALLARLGITEDEARLLLS